MTAQTQARGTAEFLLYSEDKLSLDAVTLASGENLRCWRRAGREDQASNRRAHPDYRRHR